jgi:hypothetical protein
MERNDPNMPAFGGKKNSKSLNFYAIIVKHGVTGASCGEIHGECLP